MQTLLPTAEYELVVNPDDGSTTTVATWAATGTRAVDLQRRRALPARGNQGAYITEFEGRIRPSFTLIPDGGPAHPRRGAAQLPPRSPQRLGQLYGLR